MQAECEGRYVSGIYAFYLQRVFANKLASTSCYAAASPRVREQKYYFALARRYHARLFLFDFCTAARNAESRGIARSAIFPGHGYRYRYWHRLCWPRANPTGSAAARRYASLLNIQPNTPVDWLLIIVLASRTRITINFVYCAFAAASPPSLSDSLVDRA